MTTTLMTGGTGKIGRRTAKLLTDLNHPIRIASRSGPIRFDWNDEATWKAALEGCEAAYVAYAPDLAFPGAADIVGRFATTAVAAGTTRLVLLSGRGEAGAQRAEQLVIDSGARWTVVRCAFFDQNFSETDWAEAIRAGRLELPGDPAEPMLDADDIAEVVARVLTEDGHEGRLYELTGPRLLTFAEAVNVISEAIGRPVAFEEVVGSEFASGLHGAGMKLEEAHGLAALFAEILDGRNAHLSDGVRQVLGRDPRDFGDYVQRTARTGVWDG